MGRGVSPPDPAGAVRRGNRREETPASSTWILVIDDDPAILDILTQVLVAEGYRVEGCRNGQEALDLLRESTPRLILLDLWMPKMSGWEFRQQQLMLPHTADVPVVLLSAGGNLPRHLRDLQAVDAIAKPFDLGQLLDIVEEYVGAPER